MVKMIDELPLPTTGNIKEYRVGIKLAFGVER
jgi:hypothetical protein